MADSQLSAHSSDDADSDNTLVDSSSKSKKAKLTRKNHGAAVYRTKFNPQWKDKFPFIAKVPDDNYSFYCNICKRSVKCSHMGIRDVERHVGNQMHVCNVKAARGQCTINFPRQDSTLAEQV